MSAVIKLGELAIGRKARIVKIADSGRVAESGQSSESNWIRSFLQMGLLEGSVIEVLHEAPFGGDPIAVRVRGGLIALRRQEANWISVEPLEIGVQS